jgi:predicted Zn-dependent peptidase
MKTRNLSLASKNSKSFVEKATSSLATFFSFTPTNKEETINELKPEKDEFKEEQKKIGGSKRKYTKQKQNKKQSVKKTNRKGKK